MNRCLQALYKTAGFEADDKCGNTVGYGSFLEEYARYSDFDLFKKVYTPNAAASTNVSPPSSKAKKSKKTDKPPVLRNPHKWRSQQPKQHLR